MQNAPMVRPDDSREIASAMCRPMRSCRTMTGRMSAAAANSIRWLTGYPARTLMPSRFMISAMAAPSFMPVLPVGLLLAVGAVASRLFLDVVAVGLRDDGPVA